MNLIKKPTPHFSDREGHGPTLIVIHGDAGKSDAGTVSWLANSESKVSYHYLIGRKGAVYQFVDDKDNAWHAGVSSFLGKRIGNSVNRFSIGVAFANDGTEPYQAIQYKAGGELVAALCKRYGITLDRVVGHNVVSPGRKTDPWKHFDWDAFRCEVGKHSGSAT
jgi:N-acetylmuramoyl-L-alanine amidase